MPSHKVKWGAMSDSSTRFILSVFQEAGLCSGEFPPESVLAFVQPTLSEWGLKVTSLEPMTQSRCCAVLIYAQSQAGQRPNLLELRRRLAESLAEHHLQLRIQREDLFLAMHRL